MDVNKMVRVMKEILKREKGTQPYDSVATVKRVEDGTAWVHIPGGVDETPVKLTVDAAAGDKVQVRVAGGRAWLTGNATAPPTDDKKANKALNAAAGVSRRINEIEAESSGMKKRIAENEEKTEDAMDTANGKNTVYHGSVEPTGGTYKVGDIWFDAGHGHAMHRWNGESWVKEEFGAAAIADASIGTAKIKDAAISDAKISTLDVGKLTGGFIDALHIKTVELIIGSSTLGETLNDKASNASVTEAAKTASKYITRIGDEGVKVHAESNPGSNYSKIDANGMEVVKGGVTRAKFGECSELISSGCTLKIGQYDSVLGRMLTLFEGSTYVGEVRECTMTSNYGYERGIAISCNGASVIEVYGNHIDIIGPVAFTGNVYNNGSDRLHSVHVLSYTISIASLEHSKSVEGTVKLCKASSDTWNGYVPRCIVGWAPGGTGSSFLRAWRLYIDQDETIDGIHYRTIKYGIRNESGSTDLSSVRLQVFILCTQL